MKTDKSSVRVIDFEVLSIPENTLKNTSTMTPKNLHVLSFFGYFSDSFSGEVWESILDQFWGPLGRSWGALGRPWGALGDPWGALGALLGALGVLLGALGALLGRSWVLLCALGVLSGLSWVPLAPNGGPQSSWIRFSTAFCHYFLRAGLCC